MKQNIKKRSVIAFGGWCPIRTDGGYDGVCQYVYLRQAINLGNDWLIGFAVFDEREKDNMYPSLNWARLSEIDLAWYKGDEEK